MAETIGMLLVLTLVTGYLLTELVRKLLDRRAELKFHHLSVNDLGLSAEQQIRFCALARAQGITQKTQWRLAALEYLDKRTAPER